MKIPLTATAPSHLIPINVGVVAGFMTPAVGDDLQTSQFEMDKLTRKFMCLTSQFDGLKTGLYTPDIEFFQMYLTSYRRVSQAGLMCEAELIYEGKAYGISPAHYENGISLQTATINFNYVVTAGPSSFETQFILTLVYRAPQTTWFWMASTPPGGTPAYSTINSSSNPWDKGNIVAMSAVVAGNQSPIDPTQIYNYVSYRGVIQATTDFTATEVVSGRWWLCQATTSRTIYPIQAALTVTV